jgi:hypothetical protein
MKPEITHLHLLKGTPFFTSLTRQQLHWVIDHSHEWEASTGEIISRYAAAHGSPTDVWVLLDGNWQLEVDGRRYTSGNADPGKWFSPISLPRGGVLVVAEKSYVMKIERPDMDVMLKMGFGFEPHIAAAKAYYEGIAYVEKEQNRVGGASKLLESAEAF